MTLQEVRDEATGLDISFKPSETKAQIEKKIAKYHLDAKLQTGVVPAETLKAWKKKHKVFKIKIKVSEEDIAVGYLKEPTRDHKAVAMSMYNQSQILETGEFLLQNCWLGGDARLQDDERIAESAAVQAKNIVNFLEGSTEEV